MQQSKIVTIVLPIISIILFSLISAVVPGYMWLFFVLYFAVIMVVSYKVSMKGMKTITEHKGSALFKEENTAQIMNLDRLLLDELKSQYKSTMLMMFLPLMLIFFIMPLAGAIQQTVKQIVSQYIEEEFLRNFLGFLAFYLVMFGIIGLPSRLLMRKSAKKKQLYTPMKYIVYRDGILVDRGRLIGYTEDICFKSNTDRKFVELHSSKLPFLVRLYTLEVSKLVSKLKEVKLNECSE